MRVFYEAIFIQVFFGIYILYRLLGVIPKNQNIIRLVVVGAFTAEFIIYMLGYLFTFQLPIPMLHNITILGTTWMIFLVYLTFILLFFDIVRWLFFRDDKIKRIFYVRLTFVLSFFATVIILIVGNYNFRNPEIQEKNIYINKPFPTDSLRVVVASDLHIGAVIDKGNLQRFIRTINEQNPDMVLLVGDIIDFDLRSVVKQRMQEELNQISAPYGVFVSTGNHEYIELAKENIGDKVNWLVDSTNCIVLRDEAKLINNQMYIVGREDEEVGDKRKSLEEIMVDVDTSKPVILINHEPKDIYEANDNNIDLALYGHTHNGQFFPGNLIIKIHWELPYGYKNIGNSHVYVSSGLGLAGPQFRIGTVSEILVFNLIFNNQNN